MFKLHHVSGVTCHMWCVTCHVSHVICHVSHVMCHVSLFMCNMSHVNYYVSNDIITRKLLELGAWSIWAIGKNDWMIFHRFTITWRAKWGKERYIERGGDHFPNVLRPLLPNYWMFLLLPLSDSSKICRRCFRPGGPGRLPWCLPGLSRGLAASSTGKHLNTYNTTYHWTLYPIDLVMYVYTNKQMLVQVYLDPRRPSSIHQTSPIPKE